MSMYLTLRPNAVGSSGLYQHPSSGYNWDKVDEATPDYFSTYVWTSTHIGTKGDLYNIPNHNLEAGTINNIRVYVNNFGILNQKQWKHYFRILFNHHYR